MIQTRKNYMQMKTLLYVATLMIVMANTSSCKDANEKSKVKISADTTALKPAHITDTTEFDTDDPAIWIHPKDTMQSLILGTDKENGGGIYAFDLKGKTVKKVTGLKRPNNIDVAYGLKYKNANIDIAVFTERNAHTIRVFSLPDLVPIDNGGIPVFEGETCEGCREGMGIALYTTPEKKIHAIVGRKNGTDGSYLWQYELNSSANGPVSAKLIRKLGKYSGKKEIEAIAVDNELGYIYYSDEQVGVRKYYADPKKGNEELALFATEGFTSDHEGISIYKKTANAGYILVSNQQDTSFMVYPREGSGENKHQYNLIAKIKTSAQESDGSESSSASFGSLYPKGFFVAMSDDKRFHIYDWRKIQERIDLQMTN